MPEIKLIDTRILSLSSSATYKEIINWASGFSTYDKLFFQFSCNTSALLDSASFFIFLGKSYSYNNNVIAFLKNRNLSSGSYIQLYFGFSAEKSNDVVYINGTDLTAEYARNGSDGDMTWLTNYGSPETVSNAYIPLAAANELPLYITVGSMPSNAGTINFTCKIYGVKLYK